MESTMLSRQTRGALAGTLLVIVALAVWAAPASAITWGEKDTTGKYPNVGTILASVPSEGAVYQWCSGTLIHPKVFLSAGHCTINLPRYLASGLIDKIYVSFDYDPFAHQENWLEVDSVITHPDFSFKPRSNWHDNGVLILKNAVSDITPAELPEEGFLDRLKAEGALGHGTHGAKFTVVGYGSSLSFPPPRTNNENVRQFALSEFRALLPAWLRLSQQGRNGNGGTCYGDSGGPTFWKERGGNLILVATTTWGDRPCVTSEFNQRIDVASSLSFIQGVIDSLPNAFVLFNSFGPGDSYLPGSGWSLGGGWVQGIGFTPQVSGTVDKIEIAVFRLTGGTQLDAWLLSDSGNRPGAIIEQYSFTVPAGSDDLKLSVDSSLHPLLTAGEQYWLIVAPPDIVNEEFGWYRNPPISGVWNAQGQSTAGPWNVWLEDWAPTLKVTGTPQ